MTQADYLTTTEVAKLLRISTSTVQRMAREGRLSAIKVGKLWRFPAQSPAILLFKEQQKIRKREREQVAREASGPVRNGLREFLKLAAGVGFIEPLDRAALRGGRP
ncbi:helix-turn-helix domain-containing protein [bacterium]|nr:helix-turn-helix domain-containing protein [bacterium]MBU1982881.1 helix-turn-helix domain-containing protein [bacterium]